MAAASIIASNLGFDKVIGCLVADPRLAPKKINQSLFFSFSFSLSCHIVEIEVTGPGSHDNHFSVHTVRSNPASTGAVTGKQTYVSFLSSLLGMHH